jgi:putative membrane protein
MKIFPSPSGASGAQAGTVRAKNNIQRGRVMKLLWGLGKLLTLLFWAVVLVNVLLPFVYPLQSLVNLAGGFLAFIHLLEVLLCNRSLKGRAHPWLDRLKIVIFGVFHLQTIPAPAVAKASHA